MEGRTDERTDEWSKDLSPKIYAIYICANNINSVLR